MKVTRDPYNPKKKSGWRCRWRVPGNQNYTTKHFSTEVERDNYADELEAKYNVGECVTLNSRESMLWGRLREKSDELGLTIDKLLIPVFERVSEKHFSRDLEGVELSIAVLAYQEYGKKILKFDDIEKPRWSVRHQKNVRCALNRFSKHMLQNRSGLFSGGNRRIGDRVKFERAVHMITHEEIVNYLRWEFPGESSWKQNRSVIRAFFRWCHDKGWADKNVVECIKKEKVIVPKKKKPCWLADKVKLFLMEMKPALLANWWIRFQTGIRAEDCRKLKWEYLTEEGFYGFDFNKREIFIHPTWTKSSKYWRLYDLGDAFWDTLEVIKKFSDNEWITPRTYVVEKSAEYAKIYGKRKADAMIGMLSEDEIDLIKKGKMKEPLMPQNLPRHTFAAQAYHNGLDWAISMMGHGKGVDVFNEFYKGNLNNVEALELRELRLDMNMYINKWGIVFR